MRVIVIGCGVSGLSTGIRLLEAGYSVTIWARDLPPNTTSNIAAAIWHPYKAYPVSRVVPWGQRSFEVFCELAEQPESGVRMVEAVELYRGDVEDPWWRECVRAFRREAPGEMFPGYGTAYIFDTPVVETRIYLPYLMERFERLGGEIVRVDVSSLDQALAENPVIVNCTGLGARELAHDDALFPIRGQIVRVEPPPTDRVIMDEDEAYGLTYIVPRSTDCVLGGTAEPHNSTLEPDMSAASAIVDRCAQLVPAVRDSQVVEHLVGLRPGRNEVRLEAEPQAEGRLVVHNYGHGGAGVTLSWGCAEEVTYLVNRHSTTGDAARK